MDVFLIHAVLGGAGVALATGPIGCFVVWRRMAYFGDSLAHSALLGIAIGYLMGIDLNIGIAATCLALAALLVLLQRQKRLATDTALGILSHAALALGLVAISFLGTVRVNLLAYLFGDILAVSRSDLAWIWGGGLVALGGLALMWRPLLALTVHEELAAAEGVPVVRLKLAFMLLIALVVAIAMKVVGILLITALLIVPAATARRFARSPESMAVSATILGVAAVLLGLWGSLQFDTPSGPSIVVAAVGLFVAVQMAGAASQLARGDPS